MLVACASALALLAPGVATADVYGYANGCYTLRDTTTGRFVVRDSLGYAASATSAAAATPFRMQATALGRYLFYGPGGAHAERRRRSASLRQPPRPDPTADWRVAEVGGRAAAHQRVERQAARRRSPATG